MWLAIYYRSELVREQSIASENQAQQSRTTCGPYCYKNNPFSGAMQPAPYRPPHDYSALITETGTIFDIREYQGSGVLQLSPAEPIRGIDCYVLTFDETKKYRKGQRVKCEGWYHVAKLVDEPLKTIHYIGLSEEPTVTFLSHGNNQK